MEKLMQFLMEKRMRQHFQYFLTFYGILQTLPFTIVFLNSMSFGMLLPFIKLAIKPISSGTGHLNLAEFMQAMGIVFIGLLAVPSVARSPQYADMKNIPVKMVGLLCVIVFSVLLYVPEGCSVWNNFAGLEICIFSTTVVVTAYAQLVAIDASYIIVSPVLAIIIVFIIALGRKFLRKNVPPVPPQTKPTGDVGSSCQRSSANPDKHAERQPQGVGYSVNNDVALMFITVFPYNLLWLELQRVKGGDLVLSHFLLFLCSALGAVAVLVSSLQPAGASRAAAQVLQKICTILLTVTVHAMVAEQLGGDTLVLVCVTELTAMLLWFTVHPGNVDIIKGNLTRQFRSQKFGLFIVSSAVVILTVMISMYGNERETLLSWYSAWALKMFSFSAVLCFFDLVMIYQWPGSIFSTKGPNLPILVFMVLGIFFSTTAAMVALIPLGQWIAHSVLDVTRFRIFMPQMVLGCWFCFYCLLFSLLLRLAFNLLPVWKIISPQKKEGVEGATSSAK